MVDQAVLEVKSIRKQYKDHLAVKHIDLTVPKGCIYGLLGPNGAGKTTLIRMITGITMPDAGEILLNGQPAGKILNRNIGYLPEERGLYKKMKVAEQLLYLSRLKGLTLAEAKKAAKAWLEKFDMMDWRKRKVEELSKGMQQKIQFISTVMHDPDLIILDEPFSGLDPVNTNLIKDEIGNLKNAGKSIIFSTHRMEQVEELCEKIALINAGEKVLEGDVWEIKEKYKEHKYRIVSRRPLGETFRTKHSLVTESHVSGNNSYINILSDGQTSNGFLRELAGQDIEILSYEEVFPSLNEVFIKIVSNDQ